MDFQDEKARKNEVYRTGAWVSQVVLRGGRVVGTWTHERKQGSTRVEATLFEPKRATKRSIVDALEELAPYVGEITRVTVSV